MFTNRFLGQVLKAAAIYNIVWGAWVIVFPFALFDFAGLPRPNYPEIWQCVGMIVGVYGLGYWIASYDPNRHWPIVLVGFLGKIFGPIGFIYAIIKEVYNFKFGLTIITNDLIWWVPFFVMLKRALGPILDPVLQPARSESEIKSAESFKAVFSGRWLVLLVRHSGCTFCREHLSDFSHYYERFHRLGLRTAVVHMGSAESGASMQTTYKLPSTLFVSDPGQQMYRLLGLRRGTWWELLGPRTGCAAFTLES